MIRPGHPGHGPREPAAGTPPRRPGSARRTSTLDVTGGRVLAGPLLLRGSARDLLTDAVGNAHERAAASVEVEVDRSGTRPAISRVETDPAPPGAGGLLGVPAPRGFRAELAVAMPAERAAATPLHLLLDDVPGAMIASGYAWAVEPPAPEGSVEPLAPEGSAEPPAQGRPPADICSGWRSDGTMMVALRRDGSLPPLAGPPAPDLTAPDLTSLDLTSLDLAGAELTSSELIGPDRWAWHAARAMLPGDVRRARRLDVVREADVLLVDAMFRDSYVDSDGDMTVVHEYGLTARVDAGSLEILAVRAEPRVLPWVECPAAAASAGRLVGTKIGSAREHVRTTFAGVSTCTHLNDLLGCLGDVGALANLLEPDEQLVSE